MYIRCRSNSKGLSAGTSRARRASMEKPEVVHTSAPIYAEWSMEISPSHFSVDSSRYPEFEHEEAVDPRHVFSSQ